MTSPTATPASSQYLIRSFEFAYSDEYHYLSGEMGAIQAVFDDLACAQTELDRLIVQSLRAEADLSNYAPFFEPSLDFLASINAFCIERCGQPLTDDSCYASSLPEGLSDADVLEFAQLTGLLHYRLVEVAAGNGFFALWLLDEERYACGYQGTMVYQPSVEALMEDISGDIADEVNEALPVSWEGSYEDLSDNPLLLRQLVINQPGLIYDEDGQTLSFVDDEPWRLTGPDLCALNALLKQPVFEIRQLTVPELLELGA